MADQHVPADGSTQDVVRTQVRGRTLIVTINRPEARNAVNGAVAAGLYAAFERFDEDPELRVAILTGDGGTFSSGMDLKALLRNEEVYVGGRGFAGFTRKPPVKPVIAAVEGWALAGGCEMVLACDLIVAAEDARFGLPEVKRGLVAGAGGVFRLPVRLPPHVAMELALTGDPIPAGRAYDLGFVNRITPPGAALEGAFALAAAIQDNAPLALRATKAMIRSAPGWTEEEAWAAQRELVYPVLSSEDAREGATAFAEKRAPVWKGR
jgi:enoyl-CoA hydratase